MSPRPREPQESGQLLTLDGSRYSVSLERGLMILGCFTPERSVIGIAEMADITGMSRATAHRYMSTLAVLGYLEKTPSHKYRLGLKVNDPGMAVLNSTGLREPSRPYLEELRQRSLFTASLSVLKGAEILFVERARSFQRGQYKIDLNLGLGSSLPAYCTSMGKVLLANLPEAEREDLICNMVISRRGPNTVRSKKALHMELAQVFEDGMAVNDEESASGLASIACPVRDKGGGVVAAINLAAHTSIVSLEEMIDQQLSHVLLAAKNISACLGYRGDG